MGLGPYMGLGKPTRFAPIPNPAPPLALCPIDGTNTSNTLKVAAAVNAIITTSSTFNVFLGIAYAAIATIIPSMMYLIARLISSAKSNPLLMLDIYNTKTKKTKKTRQVKETNGNRTKIIDSNVK